MSPNQYATDQARRPIRFWVVSGVGGALLAIVFLTKINQNLLFLSMLFAAFVVVSLFLRQWWTALLGLGSCAYLACVQGEITVVHLFDPAPHDVRGESWASPINQGQSWRYHFNIGDIRKFEQSGPFSGFLYIDGHDLSALLIEVQGKTFKGSLVAVAKIGIEHIAIPIEPGASGFIDVLLQPLPGSTPGIYIGPEVHGSTVYSDAVWLEFTGGRQRLIYHAVREATAAKL